MPYMIQLDGVRALAVLAVMCSHFGAFSPVWAHLGVRVFFVLSGFLITGILLRDGDLKRFYIRRSLRIFPAFYAVVLVLALVGSPTIRNDWPAVITYTGNFNRALGWGSAGMGHFWSLYVEEQFYLVWPFILLIADRRHLGYVIVSVILFSIAYRSIGYELGFDRYALRNLPMGCGDSLGAGALLAWCRHNGITLKYLWLGVPFFFWCWQLPNYDGSRIVFFDVGCAAFGLWLVDGASRGFGSIWGWALSSAPMVLVGRLSYALYLVHYPFLGWDFWNAIFASFFCAILLHVLVERPFLSLKSSFGGRTQTVPVPA